MTPSDARGEIEPTPEREQQSRPRIYVASLSDYNAGRLHGEWLRVDRDADELAADISRMLKTWGEIVLAL